MLNLVYSALKKRLTAEVSPEYVDWFYGQYLDEETEDGGEMLWATPAVFVEFLPLKWETLGNAVQAANLQFNIHLVNNSLDSDEKRVTDTASLDHLGMESDVFRALQGFRALLSYVPGFEALAGEPGDRVILETISRLSSEPDHSMGRQLVSVQTFACRIYDYAATKTWATVVASLNQSVDMVPTV